MAEKSLTTNSNFTSEEKAKIEAEVQAAKERARQAEIDAAIRNRILDEQRLKPGYSGY